jgi:hypothetical protein
MDVIRRIEKSKTGANDRPVCFKFHLFKEFHLFKQFQVDTAAIADSGELQFDVIFFYYSSKDRLNAKLYCSGYKILVFLLIIYFFRVLL